MIARTMPRSDVSKLESHLFRMYDTNRDDHIDFVEFMNIFMEGLSNHTVKDVQYDDNTRYMK